ncbi:hypothetical protein [Devosia sp. A369]
MIKVGERYNVSGSYMARVCAALNVPRPARGYWAKLAVGKAPPTEDLPATLPGDAVAWNEKGGPLALPVPPRQAIDATPKQRGTRTSKPAPTMHSLVRNYRGEFLRSRPKETGGYLKPYKKLLPYVVASEACLERALSLASKLYNELEAVGARVIIAPGDRHWNQAAVDEREFPREKRDRYSYSGLWSPARPTVAFFEEAAISIVVIEMTEEVLLRYAGGGYIRETEYQDNLRKYRREHTWTTTKPLPSGRIRVVAHSAEGVDWSLTWQEDGAASLEASLHEIAGKIREAVPQVASLVEESKRQAQIRRQEWMAAEERRRQAEDQRRVEESVKQSREQLGQVIEQWSERTAVERFFDELSIAIDQLPESDRAAMAARLQMAREFMGATDPLQFFEGWKTPRERYQPIYPSSD